MASGSEIHLATQAFQFVQILRCEVALLLFHSSEEIQQSWQRSGYYLTLGGLQVGWMVLKLEPSTPTLHSGRTVSMAPTPSDITTSEIRGPSNPSELSEVHGCLGLKIELPGGETAIATVTHAFVYSNAKQGALRRKLTFAYMKAKAAIQRFSTPLRSLSIAAEVSGSRFGCQTLERSWCTGGKSLIDSVRS
jgi:hypothetical protein